MEILRATAEANPNMALIKYWGNRDESLITPTNDNVSVTFDKLKTRTTAAFSDKFKEDEIYVNNRKMITPEELEKSILQLNFLRMKYNVSMKAKVVSYSMTPFAGGLAGSAAGLCALATAAADALNLNLDKKELSILSRVGSGSASRSVYGGFVRWLRGDSIDGSDSYAVQIADENFWPEFRIIIGMVSSSEKKVKSRSGMRLSKATSILYKSRVDYSHSVVNELVKAIHDRNLPRICEIAMRDSNNMHAVMLDSWPPIIYLNDTSKRVINAIHDFNQSEIKSAYTFDAGPNPAIFTISKYAKEIENILKECGIENIIAANVGKGPAPIEEHLIDEEGNIKKHCLKDGELIVGE